MLGYLSLDIICSSKLTVFLKLHFAQQIMSTDKYPSMFSRQMKAIVYVYIIIIKLYIYHYIIIYLHTLHIPLW